MRAINITGKHNIDKLNKVGDNTYKAIRKHMEELDDDKIKHKIQLDMLRILYLADTVPIINNNPDNKDIIDNKGKYNIKSLIVTELNHKIQGYKEQDKKKNIHNKDTLINIENVLEKLVSSILTCYYCKKQILVLYKNVREPFQWTLDRIDNSLSHTNENTCVSCLKCNLQRRVMDADKFTFTKQLKISKMENQI
jgi:hypothetical protein